jgi:RNA polymerase sigma-54 factor
LETVDGEEVSNKEVKAELQQIVDEEDKTDPMSDQELADALEEKGKITRKEWRNNLTLWWDKEIPV